MDLEQLCLNVLGGGVFMNFILGGKESIKIIHSQVDRELRLLEAIPNFTDKFKHDAADLNPSVSLATRGTTYLIPAWSEILTSHLCVLLSGSLSKLAQNLLW